MKKKFKVRVKFDYYYADKSWYIVQYANYRFIPNWKNIVKYYYYTDAADIETIMFSSHVDAVTFASKFKTIEDIQNYYKTIKKEYNQWKRRKEELYQKNKPIKITNII